MGEGRDENGRGTDGDVPVLRTGFGVTEFATPAEPAGVCLSALEAIGHSAYWSFCLLVILKVVLQVLAQQYPPPMEPGLQGRH